MRTALLSALKRGDGGEVRAFLDLAGRSVLAWQLDLVRSLECTKVICLCDSPAPQVLELQHEAEAFGMEFHAISGPMQIVGMVTADRELVTVLDGLVIEPDLFHATIAKGRGVLGLSAESRLAQNYPGDFERLDGERAWAGIAVMSGSVVEKLSGLPADGDAISLLLRLSLQSGVPIRMLDEGYIPGESMLLAASEKHLDERQNALIERSATRAPWSGPFLALADRLARTTAPAGLVLGPRIATLGGLTLLLVAVILAWFGQGVVALATASMGAFFVAISGSWGTLSMRLYGRTGGLQITQYISILTDTSAVVSIALLGNGLAEYAAPAFSLGLARIASSSGGDALRTFWSDRALHLTGLAICAVLGQLTAGIVALGLFALLYILLRTQRN